MLWPTRGAGENVLQLDLDDASGIAGVGYLLSEGVAALSVAALESDSPGAVSAGSLATERFGATGGRVWVELRGGKVAPVLDVARPAGRGGAAAVACARESAGYVAPLEIAELRLVSPYLEGAVTVGRVNSDVATLFAGAGATMEVRAEWGAYDAAGGLTAIGAGEFVSATGAEVAGGSRAGGCFGDGAVCFAAFGRGGFAFVCGFVGGGGGCVCGSSFDSSGADVDG